MKRIFNFLIVLMFVIILGLCVYGCGSNNYDDEQTKLEEKLEKNIDININVDGSINTFMVTEGQIANVTSFTKPGYYLKGVFDKNEGGVKYFDSNGESTTVWQKTYPTTLYAQWGELSELSKTLATKFSEEASYYTWSVNLAWALPSDFVNAVKGNLAENIVVTLSFRLKEGSSTIFSTNNKTTRITLKSTTGDDAETFGTKTAQSYTNNYTDYQLEWCVPARCAKDGRIIIEFNRGNDFNETYIRDAVVTVGFEVNHE